MTIRTQGPAAALAATLSICLVGGCSRDAATGVTPDPGAEAPMPPSELDAGSATPTDGSSTDAAGGLPPGLAGVFHQEGLLDEVNFRMEPNGTFRWTIYGCDFCSGGEGRWESGTNGVTLLSASGQPRFNWIVHPSFLAPVDSVVITEDAGGFVADGIVHWQDGDKPFHQSWPRGRICAQCGFLGPTGLVGCDEPVSQCSLR